MTEKSKHQIQPRYFAAALILSPFMPVLFSLSFIIVFPIPGIVAWTVLVGGLPYLIFGGPALYYWLRAGYTNPLGAAFLGLGVNAGLCLIASIGITIGQGLQDIHQVLFFLIPGSVCAMIWCAGCAFLYTHFTRRII